VNDPVDAVLDALADRTRREIVARLADGATPTATELTDAFPMSRQALVKHLQVLRKAGLVTSERRGRETRYELRAEGLNVVTGWLEDISGTWEDRLRRLKAQAEARAEATAKDSNRGR
jgi:DNA-binding transcriptional ArsR family regulator